MSIEDVPVRPKLGLRDYETYAELRPAVDRLKEAASRAALGKRRVVMLNSTARGGGVAEMMPGLLGLFMDLGVDVRWLIISPTEIEFFDLTKRLHNLIHGSDGIDISKGDLDVYERTSQNLAANLTDHLRKEDLVVVHDPQPAGCGALAQRNLGFTAVWRCHIGLDGENEATRKAWSFLLPWLSDYAVNVFSVPSYVPKDLVSRSTIIPPGIDPLGHKNRALSVHKLTGILYSAGLIDSSQPMLYPRFPHLAQRLQPDGTFGSPTEPEDIGLLFRPIVTQVSRWDKLKGWDTLISAFVKLKRRHADDPRIRLTRLVLAGPDPASIQDDPEGQKVFEELARTWSELDADIQKDIAVLSLPMEDQKQNALMVNAIQRCSSVVVQASRREGFGLTVSEALWKAIPVLGTGAAGIRAQLEDGVHGRIVPDPEDAESMSLALMDLLSRPDQRASWGLNGRMRTGQEFLVLSQAQRWLSLLGRLNGA
ncbi:MAG: glycosyltransferase [Myxococcota bacterium]